MRKNGLKSVVMMLGLSLFAVGCGGQQAPQEGAAPSAPAAPSQSGASTPDSIIIATGGTSGTYYPLGGGMAQIFSDKAGINASAQSTGA